MLSPAPGSPSHWKLILLFAWLCSCARLFAEPPLQPVTGFFRKPQFKRGDSNVDGKVDLSDAINTLRTLFSGVAGISCRDAADANGDGHLDISDPVYTLLFLFLDGERPPPPAPRECGVDPDVDRLGCRSYPLCPDDFPLIAHVLHRITFGPTEELLTQIQTKADLLRYIDEQLDGAPQNYDPALHEPDLSARVEALQIGFPSPGNPTVQAAKLKSSLLLYAMESRWQLLHVVSQFWNNHFHTQID